MNFRNKSIVILLFVICHCNSLFSYQKDSITVYLFLAEDCKITQYYTPALNALFDTYSSPQIGFIGLFPNRYSTKAGITQFKEKYKINFPLKKEFFQTKTKFFNATITPEVVVYDELNNETIYQGRIDDSYVRIGKRQRVIKNHELRDVLIALSHGKRPDISNQQAIGCFIMSK